jgi:hypothetical protein
MMCIRFRDVHEQQHQCVNIICPNDELQQRTINNIQVLCSRTSVSMQYFFIMHTSTLLHIRDIFIHTYLDPYALCSSIHTTHLYISKAIRISYGNGLVGLNDTQT